MAWNWQGERGAKREWESGKQGGRGNGGASSARRRSLFEEDTGAAQSRQITSKARSLEPCLESGGGATSSLHPHPPHPSFLRCLPLSSLPPSLSRSNQQVEERSQRGEERGGGDKGAQKGERSAMRGNRGPRLPESNRRCLFLESIPSFVAA